MSPVKTSFVVKVGSGYIQDLSEMSEHGRVPKYDLCLDINNALHTSEDVAKRLAVLWCGEVVMVVDL